MNNQNKIFNSQGEVVAVTPKQEEKATKKLVEEVNQKLKDADKEGRLRVE